MAVVVAPRETRLTGAAEPHSAVTCCSAGRREAHVAFWEGEVGLVVVFGPCGGFWRAAGGAREQVDVFLGGLACYEDFAG